MQERVRAGVTQLHLLLHLQTLILLGLQRPLHPQSNGPAQGTSAASDNNIFGHCIMAEDNNSFHNWDAGLHFLSDKEISGKFFELCDFTFTSALPVGKDRTKFASCMKKVLACVRT